jgi:hypothetical protein
VNDRELAHGVLCGETILIQNRKTSIMLREWTPLPETSPSLHSEREISLIAQSGSTVDTF